MTVTAKPAEPSQLKRIRLLSATYFSGDNLVFTKIGMPATRQAASEMLKTIDALELGSTIADLKANLPNPPSTQEPTPPPSSRPKPVTPPPPKHEEEPMTTEVETKTCSTCKKEKTLDQFGKNKRQPDGLMYSCKQCENNRAREARAKKKGGVSKPKSSKPQKEANTPAEPAAEPADKAESNGQWVERFANPSLLQLRLLSQFLGGATLDETADVCEAIHGAVE